jgi:hypothetical protein
MNSPKTLRLFGVLVAAMVGLLVVALPGTAAARDRNHDRIPDRWEKRHHLSLHKNQARRDQDRDGLKNRQEWKAGDDPRDPDSDNDGVDDGDEGAGTINSFDSSTGVLTIDLFNGGSASGHVTESTEIQCDNGDDQGDQGDDTGDDRGDVSDDQGTETVHAQARSASGDEIGDNENDGDNNDQGDDNHTCSVQNLVRGAIVQEADLELVGGEAVFESIELAQ